MFDRLTTSHQERIEELQLTALKMIDLHPVPALVRAFAWLEVRRTQKDWLLYELGLMLLRGKVLDHPTLSGLADELLAEAKRRKSPWLRELNQPLSRPKLKPVLSVKTVRSMKAQWRRETRDQEIAFRRGYDSGAQFHLIPVIALPGPAGSTVVTVWGFKAGKARWPSATETTARRERVERARRLAR